jgi:hypothetical protein
MASEMPEPELTLADICQRLGLSELTVRRGRVTSLRNATINLQIYHFAPRRTTRAQQ